MNEIDYEITATAILFKTIEKFMFKTLPNSLALFLLPIKTFVAAKGKFLKVCPIFVKCFKILKLSKLKNWI